MLINVVLTLIIVGVLLWLVERYIPMDATIKQILRVLVLVAVVLWVLDLFVPGLLGGFRFPRIYG